MRRYVTVLAILLAPLLHAATFRFDPPTPTNDTTTKLTMSGQWPDGCPRTPSVFITANVKLITLNFPQSEVACPAVIVPFSTTVLWWAA